MTKENAKPYLIEGALAVDDRGSVSFVNGFDFAGVKRFYLVTNHRAGFVRAWHAHRREAKYVTVTRGAEFNATIVYRPVTEVLRHYFRSR